MRNLICVLLLLVSIVTMPSGRYVYAQTEIKCGDMIEGEFTGNEQDLRYTIAANAGDTIRVTGQAFGKALFFGLYLVGPNELGITRSVSKQVPNPSIDSDILSAKGVYVLTATNKYFEHIGVTQFNRF